MVQVFQHYNQLQKGSYNGKCHATLLISSSANFNYNYKQSVLHAIMIFPTIAKNDSTQTIALSSEQYLELYHINLLISAKLYFIQNT